MEELVLKDSCGVGHRMEELVLKDRCGVGHLIQIANPRNRPLWRMNGCSGVRKEAPDIHGNSIWRWTSKKKLVLKTTMGGGDPYKEALASDIHESQHATHWVRSRTLKTVTKITGGGGGGKRHQN